jgi:hypothetical protein
MDGLQFRVHGLCILRSDGWPIGSRVRGKGVRGAEMGGRLKEKWFNSQARQTAVVGSNDRPTVEKRANCRR